MNRYRMFFVQTSTQPLTHAPKAYQTWKENNQLPTKSHDELKDNSNMCKPTLSTPVYVFTFGKEAMVLWGWPYGDVRVSFNLGRSPTIL